MPVTVRAFASLAEELGFSERVIEIETPATADACWHAVAGDRPRPEQVLVAVNMEFAAGDATVRDGDEVAFLPPITGGAHAR